MQQRVKQNEEFKICLTLYCISVTVVHVWPKFRFKEGMIKNISYERSVYKSVDDGSLS